MVNLKQNINKMNSVTQESKQISYANWNGI